MQEICDEMTKQEMIKIPQEHNIQVKSLPLISQEEKRRIQTKTPSQLRQLMPFSQLLTIK